jgi:hypothetical protein
MMAHKKILVKEKIQEMSDELEGDLEAVIIGLEDLGHTYFGKYTRLWIDRDYASYDESSNYELWGEREETDKEFDKRIKKFEKETINKKEMKKKLEQERYETYLLLKEKYEGGENE